MADLHEVEIRSNGAHGTELRVDGTMVRGIKHFKFEQRVGESTPTLTLVFSVKEILVEAKAAALHVYEHAKPVEVISP